MRKTLCTKIDDFAHEVPIAKEAPADGVFVDSVAKFPFPELSDRLKQLLELGDSQDDVCALYTDSVARLFVALFANAVLVPFVATDDEDEDDESLKPTVSSVDDDEQEGDETENKGDEKDDKKDAAAAAAPRLSKSQQASANITKFSLSFSVLMLRVFENFRDIFVPEDVEDEVFHVEDVPEAINEKVPCWPAFVRFLSDVVELFFGVLLKKCSGSPCDLQDSRRLFADLTRGNGLRILEELEALPVSEAVSVTVDQIIFASEAAQMPLRQLGRQICFLRISDKAREVPTFSLLAMVEAQFSRLCARGSGDIRSLRESCIKNTSGDFELFWSSVCDNAIKLVTSSLNTMLVVLRPLNGARIRSKCNAKDVATLFQRVHIKVQQFFLYIETVMLKYLRTDGNKKYAATRELPAVLLALSGAARCIGETLVFFVRKVEQAFPLEEGLQLIIVSDLRRRFDELAERLLVRFVMFESERLCVPLRAYIESGQWLRAKEPRNVGEGVMTFAQQLDRSSTIIRSFFSNACFVVSTNQSSQPSQHHRRQSSLQSQMQIPENEVCGKTVDFTADSVRAALLRTCTKTAQECVRLCSFSRSGFQQLQVDLRYLRRVVAVFASGSSSGSNAGAGSGSSTGDDSKLGAMLESIEGDAKERCNDPTPLDTTVIEHILKLSDASHQHI